MLGACASPRAEESTHDAKSVEPKPRSDIDGILDEATLDQQEQAVLFERYLLLATMLRRDFMLVKAVMAVERALLLRPGDPEATALLETLRRDMGHRSGSVSVLARDEAARYAVRLEEERLSVERLLARAERDKQSGNWDEARRNYEAALFVLRTSRFRDDKSYSRLAEDARTRARALADDRNADEKARRERETAAALREIERQEQNSR